MSCGINRKRHNQSIYYNTNEDILNNNNNNSSNSDVMAADTRYVGLFNKKHKAVHGNTGSNDTSGHSSSKRLNLAEVTPLSKINAYKRSVLPPTPGTPPVQVVTPMPIERRTDTPSTHLYLSPVSQTGSDGKENLYASIATKDTPINIHRTSKGQPTYKKINFRGKLKISLHVECNQLTLHIMEASKLQSVDSQLCSSYVQVSLESSQTSCQTVFQTAIILNNNTPMFDTKFNIELKESQLDERLLISVWNQSSNTHQLIGCMSFGLRGLTQKWKKMNGWYYLLKEKLGKSKHLRVHQLLPESNNDSIPSTAPPGCKKLSFMLKPSSEGYGFTVSGSRPVIVSNVIFGGAGYQAGLQKGDRILNVNGQNVYRSTSSIVINLIATLASTGLDIHVVRQINDSKISKEHLDCVTPVSKDNFDVDDSAYLTAKSSVASSLRPVVHNCCSSSTYSPCDLQVSSKGESVVGSRGSIKTKMKRPRCEGSSIKGHPSLENLSKKTPSVIFEKDPPPSLESSQSTGSMYGSAMDHVPALSEVLRCEEHYVDVMMFGLERFSRPLLHNIISTCDHNKLFLNVEKVVAISTFCKQQLQQICEDMEADVPTRRELTLQDLTAVLNVYSQRLKMLCDAYSFYCKSIPESISLLTRLQNNSKLCYFQQAPAIPDGYPSLTEFISQPLIHVEDLIHIFEDISKQLQQDQNNTTGDLAEIIQGLRGCLCNDDSQELDQSLDDPLECGFVEDISFHGAEELPERRSATNSDILSKISFCEDDSNRIPLGDCHLVYMSDVFYANGWQWTQMVLLLLDDVLLLAESSPEGQLSVKVNPITLDSIQDCDLDCYHPCEFSINTKSKTFVFRTNESFEKVHWCTLLTKNTEHESNITPPPGAAVVYPPSSSKTYPSRTPAKYTPRTPARYIPRIAAEYTPCSSKTYPSRTPAKYPPSTSKTSVVHPTNHVTRAKHHTLPSIHVTSTCRTPRSVPQSERTPS